MAVWDVTRLPQRDQFAYWHEVICQAFVPLTPVRADSGAGFAARVETRPLIDVNRALILSQPQATHHGPREVADTADAYYFVNLQLAGRCRARQGPGTSVVAPGQFVVVDTTRPFSFDFDDEWRMLSFRVPHEQLRDRLAGRAPLVGLGLDGARGAGAAVAALMTALWRVDETTDRTALQDLEQAFVSSLAAAAGTEPGAGLDRAALRAAVVQHVRDHLCDQTLSVTSVCRRFAVSPRTLHNAFRGPGESFAAAVRGMRLDSCAALLSDPHVRRTVTDLAHAHGFADPTSFSRAFRRRFGCSPRDVRRAASGATGGSLVRAAT